MSKVNRVPGGLQVLMAVGMTVVVTGMLAFMDTYPSAEDVANNVKNAKPTRTIFEALGTTKALVLIALPIAVVAVAAAFSLHRQRRRVWMGAAILLGAFFAFGMLQYVFPMGFLIYAVMRASKIEGPNEPLFKRRPKAGSAPEPTDGDDGEAVDEA